MVFLRYALSSDSFKPVYCLNCLSHWSPIYCFAPVWLFVWLSSRPVEWLFKWRFKQPACAYLMSHSGHRYGLSPVQCCLIRPSNLVSLIHSQSHSLRAESGYFPELVCVFHSRWSVPPWPATTRNCWRWPEPEVRWLERPWSLSRATQQTFPEDIYVFGVISP